MGRLPEKQHLNDASKEDEAGVVRLHQAPVTAGCGACESDGGREREEQ
jgi:hypothetical protein